MNSLYLFIEVIHSLFLLYVDLRKENGYVGKIQQNQKNDRTVAGNK